MHAMLIGAYTCKTPEIAAQLRVAAISLNICSLGARMELVSRALVLSIVESDLLYGFLWNLAQPNTDFGISGKASNYDFGPGFKLRVFFAI